jgi:triacylglycerol lipase
MGLITIILNSLILFLVSNTYIIDKTYNIHVPVIFTVLFVIFFAIFPSVLNKRIYNKKLSIVRDGYRLLIMFLANIVIDIHLYIMILIKYSIDIKDLLINAGILVLILNIIFWSGIIRVYLCSKQLGVRYRIWGLILGLTPIAHLIMLIIIISVCREEVYFENEKIKLNKSREKDEICKTKYPILFVHGIFFRDFEKLNYWGRIPDELVRNGATVYYGNHSSSLSVKDSAEELSKRIKEIVKETGCKRVNVIAHSKGGLDTRYAISNLGMDKYIASLTMINTPNHGCLFADYLMNKAPKKLKDRVAGGYNFTLKKLGDKEPDFIAGVTDLTQPKTEELNKVMKNSTKVYYQAYGSVLKHATSGRFPLNLTNNFVHKFDGKNDGLVGIESFPIDKDFTLIENKYRRGISHGDVIDLNRENIKGYDVREFYVQLVKDLKEKGY